MSTSEVTDLGRALRALGEHGERLEAFAATREQLDEILVALDATRKRLQAVRATFGPSGCSLHPNVPVDPAAGGRCLLCAQHQRAGQNAAPEVVTGTVAEICQYIDEHGQPAAEERFGAPAVTRAVIHCRKYQPMRETA